MNCCRSQCGGEYLHIHNEEEGYLHIHNIQMRRRILTYASVHAYALIHTHAHTHPYIHMLLSTQVCA
jgi:hypothetical protein